MIRNQPDHQHHGDTALDSVVDAAMSGILAKLEAALDHDAGLADVRARSAARQPGPSDERPVPAAPAAPGPADSGSSRLEETCDQIDLVADRLAGLIASALRAPFGGASFLELARDSLIMLRVGLASRTLARDEAERLTADARDQLAQADQVLRSRHETTLDQLASQKAGPGTALTGQVQLLRQMVSRLYEHDGGHLSLQPAR